ncbi:MAG: CRISPR-associated CARF protein Csx1 [Nitrososphaerota archaeon]
MEVLIYQVLGRLSGYSNVSYEIDGFIKRDIKLSSEALFSFYTEKKGYNAKIVYVCPNSLYKGQNILKDLTNTDLLKKKFSDEIRCSISVCKDNNFDILIINAIGSYQINGEKLSFKNTPDNFSLRLFIDMLERIKKYDGKVMLVVDISTGHNIYIASMLEALRAIIIYDKIRNGLMEKKIDTAYAISEPVGPDDKSFRRIFINEHDAKAFFALPIKAKNLDRLSKLECYVECDSETKRNISLKTENIRGRLKKLLVSFMKAFNSIKYNAPLALYTKSIIDFGQDADVLEIKLIDFILEMIEKPVFKANEVVTTSLKKKDLFNLFYSLALFKWISNEIGESKGRDGVSITQLREKTNQIYTKLDLLLNKRFLERDLNEICDKKDKIPEEWTPLGELYVGEKRQDSPTTSDLKRNFFAHSGLERTMVEVRKYKGEIELRYTEKQLNTIHKWLLNPED